MAVFTGLVFSVYREEVVGSALEPLALLTARMTQALLQWSGMEVVRTATVLSHPGGFAYEVAYSCIGALPVVFYSAAVLSYPVRFTARLVGVAVGSPLLLALNVGRLIHLFHLGVHGRPAFDWWHEDVWPGLIRLMIVGLWIIWVCWADSGIARVLWMPRKETGCRPRTASG